MLAALLDARRRGAARPAGGGAWRAALARTLVAPVVVVAVTCWAAPLQAAAAGAERARRWPSSRLLGPLVYRLAYQRLADATVLVLLIVSVGVHFALTGLGLVFFGAEGFRNPSFWDARFSARRRSR